MTLPSALKSQVYILKERVDVLLKGGLSEKKLLEVLRDACALVREQGVNEPPYFPELVEQIYSFSASLIKRAQKRNEKYDYMTSWAHDKERGEPLIEDIHEVDQYLPEDAIRKLVRAFHLPQTEEELIKEMTPSAWDVSKMPHLKSSLLARFRPRIPRPPLAAVPTDLVASRVYDARCDIRYESTPIPTQLRLSRDGSCIFLNTSDGYRDSGSEIFHRALDGGESKEPYSLTRPGLLGAASHMTLDETNKLIFVGDKDRVKAFSWQNSGGTIRSSLFPVYTLQSSKSRGPIGLLPNGTVVRAGGSQIAVWNTSDINTHGDTGSNIIGGKLSKRALKHSERMDIDDKEVSCGDPPASHVSITGNSSLSIAAWEPLVQTPSTFISYSKHDDDCVTLDLEHGAKVVSRYFGHSGIVTDVSVSGGDPQVFLTAGSDGYARLFDLRTPLPVMTFDACWFEEDQCPAVALAYPDGIPTVFTGASKGEQIKMWDVRARAPVYELSTGNNEVVSLAWDPMRHCLYAATQPGDSNHGDYWPARAWHKQNYFGRAFHAGGSGIISYAFKEDPDISMTPGFEPHTGESDEDFGWESDDDL